MMKDKASGNKFKSICHTTLSSIYIGDRYNKILEVGKEYNIVRSLHRFRMPGEDTLYHYDIYDGDVPVIVYMKTPISGMTIGTFPNCFYTKEQMRDIKLNEVLNGKV